MNPDEMVRWMMDRLMKSTAESFEIALARLDTSEREQALAHARHLLNSEDLGERELGERLKAEITRVASTSYEKVPGLINQQVGPNTHPFLPSSSESLVSEEDPLNPAHLQPQLASPIATALPKAPDGTPQKRPRGRPPKHPRN